MERELNVQDIAQAPAQKYCGQCGKPAWLEARFCQSCGLDLVAASPVALGGSGLGGLGGSAGFGADANPLLGDQDMAPEESSSGMSLGTAWMIYGVAVVVLLCTFVLPVGPAFLPIYLVTGFVMTRFVMRGIMEFHPVYSTIANVFSAKIWMFLLWPLQMGILLIKLTVNSAL